MSVTRLALIAAAALALLVDCGRTPLDDDFPGATVNPGGTTGGGRLDGGAANAGASGVAGGFGATGGAGGGSGGTFVGGSGGGAAASGGGGVSGAGGFPPRGGATGIGGAGGIAGAGGATGALTLVIVPAGASVPIKQAVRFQAWLQGAGMNTDVTASTMWSIEPVTLGMFTVMPGPGTFFGAMPGAGTIRALASGRTATTSVRVLDATVTRVQVNPPVAVVGRDGTDRATAIATFSDGTTATITEQAVWRTADPTVATVSNVPGQKGQFLGINQGTTAIVASFGGVEGMAQVFVRGMGMRPMLTVMPGAAMAQVGGSVGVGFMATYNDMGMVRTVTDQTMWTSSNPMVAVVKGNTAFCLAAGITSISATYMGAMASATLSCTGAQQKVVAVMITPGDTPIPMGTMVQLYATATLADGTTMAVTGAAPWMSTNPAIVSVGPGGIATALTSGIATVTVTYGGVTGKATYTVTPRM